MPILPQYILWVPWHFAYFLQLSGCRQRKVVLGSSYVARIFYALDHCFCVLHPQIICSSWSQTDTVKAGSLGECRNVISSNHWFYCCVLSWTWGFHRVLECYQSFFWWSFILSNISMNLLWFILLNALSQSRKISMMFSCPDSPKSCNLRTQNKGSAVLRDFRKPNCVLEMSWSVASAILFWRILVKILYDELSSEIGR